MGFDLESSDWTRVRRRDGLIKVAMRTFHVCMSGGGGLVGPCGTLVLASRRPMPDDSMTAAIMRGERWYCGCCGARYRVNFGVLNEMWQDGLVYLDAVRLALVR